MQDDEQALAARIEALLEQPVAALLPVSGGYTAALRRRVQLADGTYVFVKAATDAKTASWLSSEQRVYADIQTALMPRLIAWQAGDLPLLVLEDLGTAHWPPPWRPGDIDAVYAALDAVAATPPPAWVPRLADAGDFARGWHKVADDPAPLLALGMVDAAWLTHALPTLTSIDGIAAISGTALVHGDVRSDNLCLRNEQAVFVDWNQACVGHPRFDLAAWLPSLAHEGGPAPETILPDEAGLATVISGYLAAYAGRPPHTSPPGVRDLQRAFLRHSLPWVAHTLRLAPPW